jgi:DNA-binding NarL/FixJ family response regulator
LAFARHGARAIDLPPPQTFESSLYNYARSFHYRLRARHTGGTMSPTRNHPPSGSGPTAIILGIISCAAFSRECILARLASDSEFHPVDLGSGNPETLERARSQDPDLILVDLAPSDARRIVEELLDAVPGTRPVAVHRSLSAEDLVGLAEAGYLGFVSTDCGVHDLLRELRAVVRNEASGSPQLVGALVRSLQRKQSPNDKGQAKDHLAVLSTRERQIAHLLERRYSNKEIASELGIEFGTVKNHVHNVLTKLGLHNRWEIPHLREK